MTASPTTGQSERLLIIAPGRSERNYWLDLWAYRELLAILAWRDLAVRYKQTFIGVAWSVVRPLLTLVIFTILFSRVAKLPSVGTTPYPVMVLAGLLPWTLFSSILNEAANSLITNANLIGKVYFPRLIIPTATTAVAFVDFLIAFVILLALMLWFGFAPDWRIALLPAFVLLGILTALGPALIMTTMNVKYRDFRYVLPFVMQFGLYVSPVGFSSAVIPDAWRLLYSFNPVVGVIDGFRWCVLGGQAPFYWQSFTIAIVETIVFLWIGVRYFRSAERTFADLI
ncbi:ABC transporter permease [Sphingomonas immobilis]|uniref:Transport permease protein n=1 Tax=Sphingomonas immobilis TaxID=3063997 RepID=A0ABT8ZTN7_9SPHN|nr:ABC transporter permease [Sphingomonas sp. CA1-15]MDO7840927.1 ABC transporter permease [Sphingomonas sp. CA1-15]